MIIVIVAVFIVFIPFILLGVATDQLYRTKLFKQIFKS